MCCDVALQANRCVLHCGTCLMEDAFTALRRKCHLLQHAHADFATRGFQGCRGCQAAEAAACGPQACHGPGCARLLHLHAKHAMRRSRVVFYVSGQMSAHKCIKEYMSLTAKVERVQALLVTPVEV